MRLNVFAPLGGHTGFSVYAKNVMLGLHEVGADFNPVPLGGMGPPEGRADEVVFNKLREKQESLAYSHRDPSVAFSNGPMANSITFAGGKRFLYPFFEWEPLSRAWVHNINDGMDGLLVSSHWGADVAKRSGVTAPIRVVPGGVDTRTYNRNVVPLDRKQLKLDEDTFVFLTWGKFEPRKGHMEVLRAFRDEFGEDEKVALVMQARNPFAAQDYIDGQISTVLRNGEHKNVRLVKSEVPLELMPRLYRTADCFVLPTKGEGWGLPTSESAACGVPSIMTRLGAHMTFLNDDTSWFVDTLGLEPVDDPRWIHHYGAESKWFKIDEASLRQRMRYAFEHPGEAAAKGSKAANRMQQFKWTDTARQLLSAVGELA